MKILCFADLHHESPDFFECLKQLSEKDYDIVLSLGDNDYYDFQKIRKYINRDIYGILGNHDSFDTLQESSVHNMHRKVITINSVSFSGYDGTFKYKYKNFPSHTQEECIKEMSDMEKSDILISHESLFSLYSYQPTHCGLRGITNYIKNNKVLLNIHGHHHINIKTKFEDTNIIGIYGIALVDTKSLEVKILNTREDE